MIRALRRCAVALIAPFVVLAFAATVATATMASTVPAPNPTPTIKIVDAPFADDVVAPAGATFKLEGGGWPANTLIQLEVCGNEARSGSADCSLDTAQIVASDAVGSFRARVSVVVPPSACPCVVRAVSQANGFVAAAPVDIPGAPIKVVDDGDVIKPLVRKLDVESASLQGSDSWGAWIGGHPQRGLVFTVVNTGDVALTDATVSLSVGTSADPTGFVAPVSLGRLEVDEKKTFGIPVEFEALSFGKLVVKGNITGTTEQTTFTATTTSYPWILIAIPILIALQLILLLVRNITRRRLHRDQPPVADETPTDPERPISDGAAAAMPSDDDDEPSDDPPADESSDQNEFDPVNPSGLAALAAAEGHGYADDCIICVLEHVSERADESQLDRRLTVVRGLEATKQALLETSRLSAASTGTSMGLTLLCDDASARDTAVIDVVSILGVDRATVRQAHEASVDLGHWIEREIGLTFFVTKGKSGGPLFRCDGMPALFDDIDDIDQDAGGASSVGGDGYSSIFFSGHTSEVDLHGLIPLAVYSRTDPTARSTARRATDVEGSEGRRILSIGDFLDELLARGERDDERDERARAADDEIDRESLDGARATLWEVGASRDDVLEVSTVSDRPDTKNGDPLGGSPSVSSEPPENTR